MYLKPTQKRPVQNFDDPEPDDHQIFESQESTAQHPIAIIAFGLVGRWYWLALGLLAGFLCASLHLSTTRTQYTASSSLLIKQQTATVMSRDQVDEIDLRSVEAMNTIVARILQNRTLMERVASRLAIRQLDGLMQPPMDLLPAWARQLQSKAPPSPATWQTVPTPAKLAPIIRSWLGVSIVRGTRLINISITHPVPSVASALANAIASEYVAMVAATSTEDRGESISLLEKQSEEVRASLGSAGSIQASYARAVEACKALDAHEDQVGALRLRYLSKHPKLIAATEELQRLKQQFVQEYARARQATGGQFSWQMAAVQLPDAQADSDESLHAARLQLLAYTGILESEIRSSSVIFNAMLTRIQESNLNRQAADFSVEVCELAGACDSPIGPKSSQILGYGTLGGLVAGLMLGVAFIRLDKTYHTVAQITAETGAPILGAIARIKPRHLAVSQKLYQKRHPNTDLHAAEDRLLVFRPGCASSSYAEMYRSLHTSISRLGDVSQRKISIFTSALPGEGKTLTSANFAAAAASLGRRTLLIDLDLRKPAIHRFFGIPRDPKRGGISECLANLASLEQVQYHPPGHPNLSVIVSGKNAPNPSELLESGLLKEILAQASESFDVVVLDSAPFLAVSDTRIIAPWVHNFCFVAKAGYVPKGAIRRVLGIMKSDGIPLSGIIFNSYNERGYLKGQNYSYGYYRSAGYGRYSRFRYDSYGDPCHP
jgi:capsular exopolysaccharide synthesis family protein